MYGRFLPALAERTQTAIFDVFGAGLPIIVLFIGYISWATFTGQAWPIPIPRRFAIVFVLVGLTLFGLLGLAYPTFNLGGARLERVSAGGDLGSLIAGSPDIWGALRIVALTLVTWAVAWPSRAKAAVHRLGQLLVGAGRQTPNAARRLTSVRLPRLPQRPKSAVLSKPVIAEPLPFEVEPTNEPPAVTPPVKEAKKPAKKGTEPAPRPTLADIGISGSLPPIDVLDQPAQAEYSPVDTKARVRQIEEKMAEYGVDAKVVEVNQGPTITQFGIEPGWEIRTREVRERDADGRFVYDKNGSPKVRIEEISRVRVKVSKILALGNDLALALAVPSVRIEAPVPGKSVVGLEVPNVSSTMVSLRRVIETPQFQGLRAKSKLALALGQDVAGKPVIADLTKMPHCLIAGATGSGKSVCVNAIVASILMHATPEEVRLLMVDPKRVELAGYNDIPHLLAPVVVDAPKVVGVLRWVLKEMENRYKDFAEIGVRNVDGYNQKRLRDGELMLPYLVVIIDELADLMMVASEEVERIIVRLAQLARATGIHLLIATQRPSVDVVTGLIKANVPTRIAFAVSSSIDSRTILDQVGAEKLLGRGDMLYAPPDAAKPVRLQGVYVSDSEIDHLVAWWKAIRPPQYIDELVNLPDELQDEDSGDPLLDEARRLVGDHGRVSTSFLQRRLRIGYNRAARLMDALEEEGLIEAPESRKAVAAGVFD